MKNSLWPLDFATHSAEFLKFYFSILQDVESAKTHLGIFQKKPNDQMLANTIQKTSEQYQNEGRDHSDLWDQNDHKLSYLYYFLPLNGLRLLAVLMELQQRNFPIMSRNLLDFGSGPGTTWIVLEYLKIQFPNQTFVEKSKSAVAIHKLFAQQRKSNIQKQEWMDRVQVVPPETTGVLSYSLNEVINLPKWATDLETILIVEPSTQLAGRNLMEIRQKLLDSGFTIVAPCTHTTNCPLLKHSKKDWCHMRIHTEFPPFCAGYMSKLPMNNDTLTFSYLVATKKKFSATDFTNQVRVIGDTLYEKGKVRQAICRNDDREFLAWLTKFGHPDQVPRGSIFNVNEFEKVANELRPLRPITG